MIAGGELQSILEGPPVLKDHEVVVPLDVLTFLLLGHSFYTSRSEQAVWRREVDLFLECLLRKDFKYGQALKDIEPNDPLAKEASRVIAESKLRDFGLYGQALASPQRIEALKALRGQPLVRNQKAPMPGATSLKTMVQPLAKGHSTLAPELIEYASLYAKDGDSIALGKNLTHLMMMAHAGIPAALKSYEPERQVIGIIRECFRSVYTRATVKVERSLIQAMQRAFRQRMAGMDIILFLPLYQLVYARDKTLYQLQPSVGTWLTLFGVQGSETSYYVHQATRYIERPNRLSRRVYPLTEEFPFYLKQVENTGECEGKYPGIYLFYKKDGYFPVGDNSFFPGNFPARAFFLGEEIWGMPRWVYPQISVRKRPHAFNQLVEENPITNVTSKFKPSAPRTAFKALAEALKDQEGQWCEQKVTPALHKALLEWGEDRDKKHLFEKDLGRILTTVQGAVEGRQLPQRLAAPLKAVTIPNEKRTVFDQGNLEQKATDTVLNKYAQGVFTDVNQHFQNIFSAYLPGTTALNAMHGLSKIMQRKVRPTLFNVDVAKAFDSVDLNQNPSLWDAWLKRADQDIRKICRADWQADILKNILYPFVERVRQGFYAGGSVQPGRTPLGLTLGPLFWLYISIPLAKALVDAKDRGDCLFATITGDDTLAALSPTMREEHRLELWSAYEDFAKLGFTFHTFKNFDLNFDPERPVKAEGAFARNWPKGVPIVHAGIALRRHLLHFITQPAAITREVLHRQAKMGMAVYPTNLIRIAQSSGLLSGSPLETQKHVQHEHHSHSHQHTEEERRTLPTASLSENALPQPLEDSYNAPDVSMIELTRLTTAAHTNTALQFFNPERLLKKHTLEKSDHDDTDFETRERAATSYQEYLNRGSSVGDSRVLFQGLKKRVVDGFPSLPKRLQPNVQGSFGDAEAVMLQLQLADESVRYLALSQYGRKLNVALSQAERNNFAYTLPRSRTLTVPLVKLAAEHPDKIFSPRQKMLAQKGNTLGPRFSVYRDDETGCFKLSRQALQILGRTGDKTISCPSPNAELFAGLCTLTGRNPKALERFTKDEDIGVEVLRMFNDLNVNGRRFFRKLVQDHKDRCKEREKSFQADLDAFLGGPEGGWPLTRRTWEKSPVVEAVVNS